MCETAANAEQFTPVAHVISMCDDVLSAEDGTVIIDSNQDTAVIASDVEATFASGMVQDTSGPQDEAGDLVQDGLGTPSGCSVPEQIVLALSMEHDHSMANLQIDEDLKDAVKFECVSAVEEVDDHRYRELKIGRGFPVFWK